MQFIQRTVHNIKIYHQHSLCFPGHWPRQQKNKLKMMRPLSGILKSLWEKRKLVLPQNELKCLRLAADLLGVCSAAAWCHYNPVSPWRMPLWPCGFSPGCERWLPIILLFSSTTVQCTETVLHCFPHRHRPERPAALPNVGVCLWPWAACILICVQAWSKSFGGDLIIMSK